MTVAQQDYVWEQGEDLTFSVTYTINGTGIPAGYKARMDIAPVGVASPAVVLISFNSADFNDPVLDQVGTADNEITVASDGTGVITVRVPRSYTLPGGVIGEQIAQGVTQFSYDLFVRDPDDLNQTKILQGNITVNRSVTLWQ